MHYIYRHPEFKEVWKTEANSINHAEKYFTDRWIFYFQSGKLNYIRGSFADGEILKNNDLPRRKLSK